MLPARIMPCARMAADGGDYTAMPTPAEYTMHAGATPAAGK